MFNQKKYYYIFLFCSLLVISCEDNETHHSGGLFINEFLASNEACCPDEVGEYDDWVELYNASSEPIDVGGMFISDNLDDDLYLIPNTDNSLTTIPSNGFLILWFDKDEEQGPHHVGEKLSGDGEGIYLLSDSTTIIDSLTFEVQETDISMGRSPDGSDNWIKFSMPTPGASNK